MNTNELIEKAIAHVGSKEDVIALIESWMDGFTGDPQLICGPLDLRDALRKIN